MTTQGIEAGTGETRSGSIRQDESPVAESDAPDHPTATDWQNRAYRAEAECKELRDRLRELEARLAIELAASQHGAG